MMIRKEVNSAFGVDRIMIMSVGKKAEPLSSYFVSVF